MSKTYRRDEDETSDHHARPRHRRVAPTARQVDLVLAEQAMRETLESVTEPRLSEEIAHRIRMNADLVPPRELRDQVLIVLADYRNHSRAGSAFRAEGNRIQLADRLMAAFA